MAVPSKVSGLALTAIINIVLEVLFFALYSIFRKQPSNANIYLAARIQREKGSSSHGTHRRFALENYLPSSDWLKEAWKLSEDEIMKIAGLDSLVLIRIYVFCFRFFGACTVLGLLVLVPVNYYQGQSIDIDNITNVSLDAFTISNVENGSERLWAHLSFLYVISFLAYLMLYLEYRHIAKRRIYHLQTVQPKPGQFTILVRAVPKSSHQSYSQQVDDFFCTYYPDTYLLQQSVYASTRWQKLLGEIEWVAREIQFLKLLPARERIPLRTGFLGLSGRRDPLKYYMGQIEELKDKLKKFQATFFETRSEIPVSFVSFRTRWSATVAAYMHLTSKPSTWVTDLAPEPSDVNWRSLSISFSLLWMIRIIVGIIFVFITILFFVPAGMAWTLGTLENLKTLFPFATKVLSIPVISTLVNGYLPSLILAILYLCIPPLMLFLTEFEGYPSMSAQEMQTCGKVFLFLIANSFFLVAYGSVLNLLNQVIESPREIPGVLASGVTSQVNNFMNLVMTKGWTGLAIEILQPSVLIPGYLRRHVLEARQYGPYTKSLPYFKALPNLLLFIFIGFMYVIIAPLMLPFLMIYFLIGYIVFRNQILNRYEPIYETGGQYWPHIHNRIIFCVFMMQVVGIGIFGVKHKPWLSSLSVPLLAVTLLFHYYCGLRFHPIFKEMSMQVAVSRDREDERNGLREEALKKLRKAYLYPAFQSIETNEQIRSIHEPLLPG